MALEICRCLVLLFVGRALPAALAISVPSASIFSDVQAVQHASSGRQVGSGVAGHPRLTNIRGEKFAVARPGKYVLFQIPMNSKDKDALLKVEGSAARPVAGGCGEIVFESMNVTGRWAEERKQGGFQFSVRDGRGADWEWFGKVELRMEYMSNEGTHWLSLGMRHMRDVATNYRVGGLLGDGSHVEAATPTPECNMLDLMQLPLS